MTLNHGGKPLIWLMLGGGETMVGSAAGLRVKVMTAANCSHASEGMDICCRSAVNRRVTAAATDAGDENFMGIFLAHFAWSGKAGADG